MDSKRQAAEGGCQTGWGRLVSVTNARRVILVISIHMIFG